MDFSKERMDLKIFKFSFKTTRQGLPRNHGGFGPQPFAKQVFRQVIGPMHEFVITRDD